MMNPLKQLRKRRRPAVTGEAMRLTGKLQMPAGLQPPEMPADKGPGDDGIIRPQTGKLHMSAELFDSGENISDASTNRIVIGIVGFALVFIAFIAWLIAHD
jgi:hypothetical protein